MQNDNLKFKIILFSSLFLVFLFFSFYFLLSFSVASAAEATIACQRFQYPWCNLPESDRSPAGIVRNFYVIALGLAGAAALGVLAYAGILWTVSGAVGDKKNALDYIKGALWGVVLLVGAVLILRTINPNLVDLINPGLPEAPRYTPPAPSPVEREFYTGIPLLEGNSYSHSEALRLLREQGIEVTSSGGILGQNVAGSTSLEGMTGLALNKIMMFKRVCELGNGELSVIGANETAGHSETTLHGNGYTFDFSSRGGVDTTIRTCLEPNLGVGGRPGIAVRVRNATVRGAPAREYTLEEGTILLREQNPPHWHVSFSPFNRGVLALPVSNPQPQPPLFSPQ